MRNVPEIIMPPTTVISVRGQNRDALLGDENFVYVGRSVRQWWKGSKWGNPFTVGMARSRAVAILGRDIDSLIRAERLDASLACRFYFAWVSQQKELLADVPKLAGKRLGCWCACWAPGDPVTTQCHGIVLAKLANLMTGDPSA